jgi:hypothetical protein
MEVIKAIETTYAGCRFRSRLEARWAVFFDHLGTPWEYEPEGVVTEDGTKYLPDFWLPEMRLWAEVKGTVDRAALNKVGRALPALRPHADSQVTQVLVVLGPVPRPGHAWTHTRFDLLGDRWLWQPAFFHGPDWAMQGYATPCALRVDAFGREHDGDQFFCDLAIQASVADRLTVDPLVDAAYAAARSARFEFGQSGA